MTMARKRREHLHEDDHGARLQQLRQLLDPDILPQLERTGEVRVPGDTFYQHSVLHRFLAAEKFDVHRAAARLTAHAAWRAEALPTGSILEDEVGDQIAQQKVLLQPRGSDGRPLLIIRVSRHFSSPASVAQVERFVIFCLEAASRACEHRKSPDAKLWALFDLDNVRWANMDRHALTSCFHLLNSHFPERVLRIFMVNSPMMFDALWRIVRPFVDPTTRKKVCFVYGDAGLKEVMHQVDPAIIPIAYGGRAKEVPVEVAAREWLGHVHTPSRVQKETVELNEGVDREEFYDAEEEDGGPAMMSALGS